jgi:hypothetical protein
VELEDKLRVQRHWLFGRTHRRTAMHLSFAHGSAPLDARFRVGSIYDAELVFYPGSGPRAALRGEVFSTDTGPWEGYRSVAELLDNYAGSLASCPWLDRLGLPLLQVTPQREASGWLLCDSTGQGPPLRASESQLMLLLAVCGGRAVDIAVEFDGRAVRALCVAAEGDFVDLTASGVGEAAA